MTTYTPTPEAVEAAAKAMADDWSPDRDPILTAMFRDYAMSALTAAGPIIAAGAECSLLNHENRLAEAAVKIDRLKAERDEAQRQVADLRAGIEAAVVTLNREAYRQPTPWIDRLANRLCALLAEFDAAERGPDSGGEPDRG